MCGLPGTSLKTNIKTQFNEKVVENGFKVQYSCDYNDAPFIIGHSERQCLNGEWTNTIPKCATLYTGGYEYNYTINGNAINVSLATKTRISGLVVKVSSLEAIDVVNIKNIPAPDCYIANITVKDQIPYHSTKRFSTLFHCPTKNTDIWMHSSVSWILITFSEKFRNCELVSCPAVIEFIELYEAVNDECFRPDVPAFGKVIAIKQDLNSNTIMKYKYQCNDYFSIHERGRTSSPEIVCTPHEEWSIKRLPKCVPNMTCNVEQLNDYNLKVSYNWMWSTTEAVVGTVATFECIDNSTKINGTTKRECESNGQWSEELPKCINQYTSETTIESIKYETTSTTESTLADTKSTETQNQIEVIYPSYPPVVRPQTTLYPYPQFPALNTDQTNNSLNTIHFVYIFLGILLGILITIGVIYYIQKRRKPKRVVGHPVDRQLVGSTHHNNVHHRANQNQLYFDSVNQGFNDNHLSDSCIAESVAAVDNGQRYPYDSAGYIQIEAVETMRLNSFKKYENYDNNSRKLQPSKPLPQPPK
ncbi:uncharacterized protein LOC128958140 [Oppia nitens]|uniref:uncharacterized protein LOC128958140 n=1 Tax=Oppia nitens TaxID=1686743 RepID=UPI0023DB79AC|nr:uncharacterized protein LOC128958140 [Oppia nitens]